MMTKVATCVFLCLAAVDVAVTLATLSPSAVSDDRGGAR